MGNTMVIHFGSKEVSRDGAPFVLAEIGVNHDGDVEKGRRLVDAAARAGADGVKFQLFRADLLLAQEAGLVDYQKASANSAQDLLKPLEMAEEPMAQLIAHAHSLGLAALVTPFSVELVDAVVRMNADGIKLASPDLVNRPLVERAARTSLPLVLSSGAAEITEIARSLTWLSGAPCVILHCVSSYPTPDEMATIGAITAMRAAMPREMIGYSDHTAGTFSAALAVAAGACLLEKHLTLDRNAPGPDHAASLEPDDLAEYVRFARRAFVMRGAYEKRALPIELPVRQQTRQSVVLTHNLPAGHVLTAEDVTVKRPGTGIPAAEMKNIIGRRLTRDVAAGVLLKRDDVE